MNVPTISRVADLAGLPPASTALDRPVSEALELARTVPERFDAGLAMAGAGLRGALDRAPRWRSRGTGRRRAVVLLVVSGLLAAALASWWGRRARASVAAEERRFDDEALGRAADEGMAVEPGAWRMSAPMADGADGGSPPIERAPMRPPVDEVVVRQASVGVGIAPRR